MVSTATPRTTPAPSLRVQAYQSFQQQIVQANIRPGQFISQRELMQLLGMPLGAVRELIPRLEAEGLLRTVPQRGLQIAHVDLKLINNAFQFRLLLEREAAAQFARGVSDADLHAIEDAHLRIVKRARSGRIDDHLLSDATTVLGLATNIGFIGLYNRVRPTERAIMPRTVHCFADTMAKEPCTAIGDA